MNVLVLVPSPFDTSPAQRFGIEQWAPHLERLGARLTFSPFMAERLHRVLYQRGHYSRKAALTLEALGRRVLTALTARRYDLVFLHREAAIVGPAILERIIAYRNIPIIYTIDDPLWIRYRSPTNGILSYLKFNGKVRTICRISAAILANSQRIARYVGQFNHSVHVVPQTIDVEQYHPRSHDGSPAAAVTLGWIGSHTSVANVLALKGALRRVAARYPVRLCLIANSFPAAVEELKDAIPVVLKRWDGATEASELRLMDIALLPLDDHPWNAWKVNTKLLQYAGAGVPIVASTGNENAEIIQDGGCGFVARDEDEWVEKLSRLVEDAALRRDLGSSGRRMVEERFSAQVWAPKIYEVFENAVASRCRNDKA